MQDNTELYGANDFRNYSELYHHGILGQKWGVRRYQNSDGSLTDEGRKRYGITDEKIEKMAARAEKQGDKLAKRAKKVAEKNGIDISEKPTTKQEPKIKLPKEIEYDIAKTIAQEREKQGQKIVDAKEAAKLEKQIEKAMGGRKINYDAVQKLQNARDLKIKDLSEDEIEAGRVTMLGDSKQAKAIGIGAAIGATAMTAVAAGEAAAFPPGALALGAVGITWGATAGATVGAIVSTAGSKRVKEASKTYEKLENDFREDLAKKLSKKYANDPRIKEAVEKQFKDADIAEANRRNSRMMQQQMIQQQNQIMQQQIQQQTQMMIQQQIDTQIQMQIQNQINNQIQNQINMQTMQMNNMYMSDHGSDELYHHGVKGQKWGVRRYQNSDGSLTAEGKEHYSKSGGSSSMTNAMKIIENGGKDISDPLQRIEAVTEDCWEPGWRKWNDPKERKRAQDAADLGIKAIRKMNNRTPIDDEDELDVNYWMKSGYTREQAIEKNRENNRDWFLFEDQTIGLPMIADLVNQGYSAKQVSKMIDIVDKADTEGQASREENAKRLSQRAQIANFNIQYNTYKDTGKNFAKACEEAKKEK